MSTSTWATVLLAIAAPAAMADESPLNLADLGRYRTALIARAPEPTPLPATFRALWDHPERYVDRRVQVEGRVVRRFRQGPHGTFPALVEAWAVNARGEPFCWVYPESGSETVPTRDTVRFVGTYLRRIRYEGADVPRLAPLIVGPLPPSPAPVPARRSLPGWPGPRADWILGLVAGLVVAGVLVAQHLRKPPRRMDGLEPAPDFSAGQSASHDDAERPRDIT